MLKSFAVVILGGLGNIPGAIAGGFVLGIVEAYAIFFMSAGWQSVLALDHHPGADVPPAGPVHGAGRAAVSAATTGKPRSLAASTPARVLKVAVLLGLLVFVPPLVDSPYVTTVCISALLFGLFGAVYDLMIGYAGLANFGYAGFIAAGACTARRSPRSTTASAPGSAS